MVSKRDEFAMRSPTSASMIEVAVCPVRNLSGLIARIESEKTAVPEIAQLEVLTDERK